MLVGVKIELKRLHENASYLLSPYVVLYGNSAKPSVSWNLYASSTSRFRCRISHGCRFLLEYSPSHVLPGVMPKVSTQARGSQRPAIVQCWQFSAQSDEQYKTKQNESLFASAHLMQYTELCHTTPFQRKMSPSTQLSSQNRYNCIHHPLCLFPSFYNYCCLLLILDHKALHSTRIHGYTDSLIKT